MFLLLLVGNLFASEIVSRTKVQMGTFITISTANENIKYIQEGFNIMKGVENSLSSYDKNALVYKLNRDKEVALDDYLYDSLLLSQKYYQVSDGYFDITIGSLSKDLFRFGLDERIPTAQELKNATVNFNGLEFNKTRARLLKGVKIDLGGMGKGYGVDKVAEHFRKNNLPDATIAASGDIRCLGLCMVDVDDPFSEGALFSFKTIDKDMGISTSGNYNRYVKTLEHNHLINPKTKKSEDKFISITLISAMNNSDLDAYATAASVMPISEAYEFLDSLNLAYFVLQSDGKMRFSSNFDKYATKKQKDSIDNQNLKRCE